MSVWIISVGSTDLQLPLYTRFENEYGAVEWRCTHRARLPEGGLRTIHEGLEKLARFGLIKYIAIDQPLYRTREDEDPPKLVLMVDEVAEGFTAEYARVGTPPQIRFRLDPSADELPTDRVGTLPLALPKLEPILTYPPFIADRPLAVVVLNTRRARDPREPVASGPLVAQRMAEALGLACQVRGDPLDELPGEGCASSVDIVCGNETFEADEDQNHCRQRLLELCRWIEAAFPGEERIWLTNSGGPPQIKDSVRRTIQTFFGEARVTLLTVGEKTEAVVEQPLAQVPNWADRDRMRGAVARALRGRKLVTAFGLASSLRDLPQVFCDPWVGPVIGTLGPLCTLPTPEAVRHFGSPLEGSELVACRCEAALMQDDLKIALLHLGTLFEVLVSDLIRAHPVFSHPELVLQADGRMLTIHSKDAVDHLNASCPLFGATDDAPLCLWSDGSTARIGNSARQLPKWFDWMVATFAPMSREIKAAQLLRDLHASYSGRDNGILALRNQVAHESIRQGPLATVRPALIRSKIVWEKDGRLTLLNKPDWANIFNALHPRTPWLGVWLDQMIADLLEQVRAPMLQTKRT